MFPISKREKRGKTWVIILLVLPPVFFLFLIIQQAIQWYPHMSMDGPFLLILGILFLLWGIISFAAYQGKWAGFILLILATSSLCFIGFKILIITNQRYDFTDIQVIGFIFVILFCVIPSFLLFLPAPNAFLRYQREKDTRHLAVLEHQLKQIGKDE
ncbi:MAG: hypothetical protein AB8H47_17400 [Bacteroidia bacterium]